MEVSGHPNVPVALAPEQVTLFPLNRRLGDLHSQSDLFGEKSSLSLPGIGFAIVHRVA
jgi:hypothetical protein